MTGKSQEILYICPMRIFRPFLIPMVFLVLAAGGCGDRLPSPKTAHRVIQKSFQKYGKKYKASDFGKHRVERVEISHVEELQKNLASVEANIQLNDGSIYRTRVTLQKKTFRWRSVAWENLGAPEN